MNNAITITVDWDKMLRIFGTPVDLNDGKVRWDKIKCVWSIKDMWERGIEYLRKEGVEIKEKEILEYKVGDDVADKIMLSVLFQKLNIKIIK